MESRRQLRPSLELLEHRWTPAGTVTGSFANGTWTLIGDGEANEIQINPAVLGPFTVAGLNGTTVTGVTNPNNVKHIVVLLGAGDDWVEVNDTGVFFSLPGNLTMRGGSGANHIDIHDFQVRNLTIRNGINLGGADRLRLSDSIVQKNVTIKNGAGDSETSIFRSNPGISSIGGSVIVRNGSGNDVTEITDTEIAGNVTVKNGLPDAIKYAGYAAIYNIHNDSSRSLIGGNVFVSYRAGYCDNDGIWDTEVLGNVQFNYGSGDGQVHFDGYTVVQPVQIHGNLTLIGSRLQVEIGHQFEETGLNVGKNVTFLAGGREEIIDINRLSVGGITRFATGGGEDIIFINDSTFAGLTTILTGANDDYIAIDDTLSTAFGTQFATALEVNLGAGDDRLLCGAGGDDTRWVELVGRASLSGGPGSDTLYRYNLASAFGAPIDVLFETIQM